MVDILALSVAHAALLIALWRLIRRSDLDREAEADGSAQQGSQDA